MARKRSRGPSRASRYSAYAATIFLVLASVAVGILYLYGGVTLEFAMAALSITASLFFPSIVFTYLLRKGVRLNGIVDQLGLSRRRLTLRNLGIGVLVFLAIMALSAAFGVITEVTGIQFPTNVDMLLSGMPLYFLAFAAVVAPFNEEVFFRGFLVNRIGVFLSAIVFAFLHSGYSSVSEVVAAFVFGLIAAVVFRRTRSLYPSLLAHVLINALAIITVVSG